MQSMRRLNMHLEGIFYPFWGGGGECEVMCVCFFFLCNNELFVFSLVFFLVGDDFYNYLT
jgi:hypothetical protein